MRKCCTDPDGRKSLLFILLSCYAVYLLDVVNRVTTFQENLEMSGSFAVVREMSANCQGISGKNLVGENVVFKEQNVYLQVLIDRILN